MRVIVCGGRKYNNVTRLYSILGKLHRERGIDLLINGGAPGADGLASGWAAANLVKVEEYPAEWDKYGGRAGPIRNAMMLDENPDAVVAFPGGRGTADMVRRAKAAGVPVWEIRT
jgi:predicted Rossmann-fold nucleotide-binding protein